MHRRLATTKQLFSGSVLLIVLTFATLLHAMSASDVAGSVWNNFARKCYSLLDLLGAPGATVAAEHRIPGGCFVLELEPRQLPSWVFLVERWIIPILHGMFLIALPLLLFHMLATKRRSFTPNPVDQEAFKPPGTFSLDAKRSTPQTKGLIAIIAVLVGAIGYRACLSPTLRGAVARAAYAVAAMSGLETAAIPLSERNAADQLDVSSATPFWAFVTEQYAIPTLLYLCCVIAAIIVLCVSIRVLIQGDLRNCVCCGYCLIGLSRDRCPECGTLIPEEQRLAIASSTST